MSEPRLVLVEPYDKHARFHDFLVSPQGMDGVHPFEGKEHLFEHRLGGKYSSRRVFVLVDGEAWDPRVLSAIYTRSGQGDITNIEELLGERVAEVSGIPTHYQFYSVTNVLGADKRPLVAGAAKILIGKLKQFLEAESGDNSKKKTLSPFRSLSHHLAGKNVRNGDFYGLSDDEKIGHIMAHFCERARGNLAQRAHMPNGAVLREIYLNAASAGHPDGLCMVSYDYTLPSEELAQNAVNYGAGQYPVDPSLQRYLACA